MAKVSVWLQVISNPFDDIVPRVKKPKITEDSAEFKKHEKRGTKLVIAFLKLRLMWIK